MLLCPLLRRGSYKGFSISMRILLQGLLEKEGTDSNSQQCLIFNALKRNCRESPSIRPRRLNKYLIRPPTQSNNSCCGYLPPAIHEPCHFHNKSYIVLLFFQEHLKANRLWMVASEVSVRKFSLKKKVKQNATGQISTLSLFSAK